MTGEFLERCNGLPVIFRHPEKTMLNTKEFRNRIVGTIFVPYFQGDEVWGIAKILDMEAAKLLETHVMSTSPAVLCLGEKFPTKDGKHLLIEQKPYLLDHLAILIPETDDDGAVTDTGAGVWDKGADLSGVESVDALPLEDTTPLDTILSAIRAKQIDQLTSRL
jgi:hypothetical protein